MTKRYQLEQEIAKLVQRTMKMYEKNGYGKDYLRMSTTKQGEIEMGFYIRNLTPIDDKPEAEWGYSSHHGAYSLGIEPKGNGLISEKIDSNPQPVREIEPISILEIHNKWSSDINLFMVRINELIDSHNQLQKVVNSLKGE
jgi:hypothetical protein